MEIAITLVIVVLVSLFICFCLKDGDTIMVVGKNFSHLNQQIKKYIQLPIFQKKITILN